MKRTKKDFEKFKQECLKWQEEFGLKNWKLYFAWDEKATGRSAAIMTKLDGYVAMVFLSPTKAELSSSIEELALHEMIHLLLARLSENAGARHATENEIIESEEEVVRTLEAFIIKK